MDRSIAEILKELDQEGISGLLGTSARKLDYGENRHETAEVFDDGSNHPLGPSAFELVFGDSGGMVNMTGGDALINGGVIFADAHRSWFGDMGYLCFVAKHGMLISGGFDLHNPIVALHKALIGDIISIMGGEMFSNFPIDETLAQEMKRSDAGGRMKSPFTWGLDYILAPSFTKKAIEIIGPRGDRPRRLWQNPALNELPYIKGRKRFRPVIGGHVEMKGDHIFPTPEEIMWADEDLTMSDGQIRDGMLSFTGALTAYSNSAAGAKNCMFISVCGGGGNRLEINENMIRKARKRRHDMNGAISCNDGFYPYPKRKAVNMPMEAPERLVRAGFAGGFAPKGGGNFEEVVAYHRENNQRFGALPRRLFTRH